MFIVLYCVTGLVPASFPADTQRSQNGGEETIPAVFPLCWFSELPWEGSCAGSHYLVRLCFFPKQTLYSFAKCTWACCLVSAHVSLMEVPLPESLNEKKK